MKRDSGNGESGDLLSMVPIVQTVHPSLLPSLVLFVQAFLTIADIFTAGIYQFGLGVCDL